MSEENLPFQAEVSRLLDIVAHSLYSEREVFLRELISNASDACDKLRFESIGKPELLSGDAELHIDVSWDADQRTATVRDNGVGMSRDEIVANIGTIASSGTRRRTIGFARPASSASFSKSIGVTRSEEYSSPIFMAIS